MAKQYVLITGGSKNIGAAICRRASEDGFNVISVDIAKPTHKYCKAYFQSDLSSELETHKVLSEITNKFNITNLINNVGIVSPDSIQNTSIRDFNEVMNINTKAALMATKAVIPSMKKNRGGRIVSIVSRVILGKELRTSYSASKGALLAMTRTWALELAPYGITVNCVAPGPIGTSAFWENNPVDAKQTKTIVNSIPVKRMGTANDVAHAVSYFLDDRSSFVTGQILYVCGGLTVGLSGI